MVLDGIAGGRLCADVIDGEGGMGTLIGRILLICCKGEAGLGAISVDASTDEDDVAVGPDDVDTGGAVRRFAR